MWRSIHPCPNYLSKGEGSILPEQVSKNKVLPCDEYLQGHIHSDTTFATSQCAQFIHCIKRSHDEALERLGQYLKATGDNGLILHPKSHKGRLDIACYVDAYHIIHS
jgi:hypothetical protein